MELSEKVKAERLVREILGTYVCEGCYTNGRGPVSAEDVQKIYNALVSKTAELMEMTAQRDEAQKALEEMQKQNRRLEKKVTWVSPPELKARAESAEATIREQAERIKELEGALEEIRDDVLHERGSMAEMDFGNDRVNAVLGVIDDHTPRGKQ